MDSTTLFGKYAVAERLGGGGLAEVHRARVTQGPHMGRSVALKRLSAAAARDAALVDQFLTEADLCRNLHHPAIVDVLEAGVVHETYYIALELMEGPTLHHLLNAYKARELFMPYNTACYLAYTLAGALSYIHSATDPQGKPLGLIHCDVTPSNIFLSRRGEVKLGDFGIAYVATHGSELFSKNTAIGKPEFMAPELSLGVTPTPAVDLFALGVLLYIMLTHQLPFSGASAQAIWRNMLTSTCRPPSAWQPDLPPALDHAVLKALSPRPPSLPTNDPILRQLPRKARRHLAAQEPRYGDAHAFADALKGIYDGNAGTAMSVAVLVHSLPKT